jgi:hypothetical protein
MIEIPMTKEDCGTETVFVLNFEHLDFDIVSASPGATGCGYAIVFTAYEGLALHYRILKCQVWAGDFGFRYSDFYKCYRDLGTC